MPRRAHLFHLRLGEAVAVLDRVHTRFRAAAMPSLPDGVGRHFVAETMGFVHDGFGFFVGEIHMAVQHDSVRAVEIAVVE